jgi:predicted ATP-grasp superfamily ATP-dependent carboligase
VRIFAFEFFSGGGLAGLPLPPGIAYEGDLMLRALIQDLSELPGIDVFTSRDPRLPPLPGIETIVPLPGEDVFALFGRGLRLADAVWPTAPETDGTLERLARAALVRGAGLLGCLPDGVRLTASKRTTARALRAAGIPAVPTFAHADRLVAAPGPWITKPDDGAGCEDTELHPGWTAARARLAVEPARLVAQPWIDGGSLSLSVVCDHGVARLLCCNRQEVGVRGGRLSLDGLLVNAVADRDGLFSALAGRVAAAVPGLSGYVGIDLVAGSAGPVVLEINPRLTTSYCGLRSALGINVAAMVVHGLSRGVDVAREWPPERDATVAIGLAGCHAS